MKNQVKILVGGPLREEEAYFLRVLSSDLASTGALILGNFVIRDRQIDFLVVMPRYAALIELKTLPRPIFSESNGAWEILDATGNRVEFARENPLRQTSDETFAVSDAMRAYSRNNPNVPVAPQKGYFRNFESFVCIYPQIHRDSKVTTGDGKIHVRSYPDVLDAIRTKTINTSWTERDWLTFAEQKLHLKAVSLQAAIDPRALAAEGELTAYRQRIKALVETGLPPLVEDTGDGFYGSKIIQLLEEPSNYLLHGPSGSAKTFHLHHLALALAAGDREIPFLIDAKRYRGGDFWPLLRQSLAPYSPTEPKQFLSAMESGGYRPVLLIDALNETDESLRADLLKGALAFALHYDARTIVSAQDQSTTLGGIQATTVALSLPNRTQKRHIYAYHADIAATPDLDTFCDGFTNAYDLALAGQCHASGLPPQLRVEIYDRYILRHLPAKHAIVASALLRHLAGTMNESASLIMSMHDCTLIAEAFLHKHEAGLNLLDQILDSRLVQATPDSFAFEHELLFRYFKAEHLRRTTVSVSDLTLELRKPRHEDLLEYVLPRFTNDADIALLLTSATTVKTLQDVHAGRCGVEAQTLLRSQCENLLRDSAADLPRVSVKLITTRINEKESRISQILIQGVRPWTHYDFLLSEFVPYALKDPKLKQQVFQLLDDTESVLRIEVERTAREAGFKFGYVWSETIRFFAQWVVAPIPSCKLFSSLLHILSNSAVYTIDLAIRADLLKRFLLDTNSALTLLLLLEDQAAASRPELVEETLDLIGIAWDTGIPFLRITALNTLTWEMRSAVEQAGSEQMTRVRAMLESFETINILLNTQIVEALSIYDAMEPPVSVDAALNEMREALDSSGLSESDLRMMDEAFGTFGTTMGEFIATRAYALIGKIFEDVFQGAYFQAYEQLSHSETVELLSLAAQSQETGFHSSWILQQLLKLGDQSALPIFQQIASHMNHDSSFQQDEVATFILAIQGCARWSDEPPVYRSDATSSDRAWSLFGIELFWIYHAKHSANRITRKTRLWEGLLEDDKLAAGVILSDLHKAKSVLSLDDRDNAPNFMFLWREDVLKIAEYCLERRGLLDKTFWRHNFDSSVSKNLITALGDIGDKRTLRTLQHLIDDPTLGRSAILAIESIQRRQNGST
jgi:hypothetical protein